MRAPPQAPRVDTTSLSTCSVLVCTGPGGVGKTTVSAALAVALASSGRRVALVTIDPARRLGDALGVAELTNVPQPLSLPRSVPGSVHALMLDARATFDDLVRRNSASPQRAERILANGFYRAVAGSLGGTQEYMANEKLYELVHEPRDTTGTRIAPFDVVVVDTPPTACALDFLESPARLVRFFDNRLFRAVIAPGRTGLRAMRTGIAGAATNAVLATIAKVVGTEVVGDAVTFFQGFEGMEAGFRARAVAVASMLRSPTTGWVVVTSPRDQAVAEVGGFLDELGVAGVCVVGVVANRVAPRFGPLPDDVVPALEDALDRVQAANRFADAHDAGLARLSERADLAGGTFARLHTRANDVSDLRSLVDLATELGPQVGLSGDRTRNR